MPSKPGRPPNKGSWKPGVVMNPGGRPKTSEEVKERLRTLTMPAVEKLAELIKSDNENVALSAVKEVLDRNLGRAVTPVLVGETNPFAGISTDDLIQIVRGTVIRKKLSDGRERVNKPNSELPTGDNEGGDRDVPSRSLQAHDGAAEVNT